MTLSSGCNQLLGELSALSARVGRRIDLVHGPGGNVSIKEGAKLWVKASGTWLENAETRNIFVPVDLARARALIDAGSTDLSSCVVGGSTVLRPSIETAMHALIHFPVVVHLHSINALAWAVRMDGRDAVAPKLDGLNWGWIEYQRPGPHLAEALRHLLGKNKSIKVVLLGNHGLVMAADSIAEAEALIETVEKRLSVSERPWQPPSDGELGQFAAKFACRLPTIKEAHALARDPLSLRLASGGVLYPDHAVFLGKTLPVVSSLEVRDGGGQLIEERLAAPPYCVIVEGKGVFLARECTAASEAMLACCALVALRQRDPSLVRYLPVEEVEALCNWEMEEWRKSANERKH